MKKLKFLVFVGFLGILSEAKAADPLKPGSKPQTDTAERPQAGAAERPKILPYKPRAEKYGEKYGGEEAEKLAKLACLRQGPKHPYLGLETSSKVIRETKLQGNMEIYGFGNPSFASKMPTRAKALASFLRKTRKYPISIKAHRTILNKGLPLRADRPISISFEKILLDREDGKVVSKSDLEAIRLAIKSVINFRGGHLNFTTDVLEKETFQKLLNYIFKNRKGLTGLTLKYEAFARVSRSGCQAFLPAKGAFAPSNWEKDKFAQLGLEKLSLNMPLVESSFFEFILKNAPNLKEIEILCDLLSSRHKVREELFEIFSKSALPKLKKVVIEDRDPIRGRKKRVTKLQVPLGEKIQRALWATQLESFAVSGSDDIVDDFLSQKDLPHLTQLKLHTVSALEWKLKTQSLKTLWAQNCGLKIKDLPGLLQGAPVLTDLNLAYNHLYEADPESPSLTLPLNVPSSLESLSLEENKVKDEDVGIIFSNKTAFGNLKHLNLQENLLTAKGVEALLRTLAHNGQPLKLESLNLRYNDQLEADVVHVIKENCTLLSNLKQIKVDLLKKDKSPGPISDAYYKELKEIFPKIKIIRQQREEEDRS